MAAIPSSGSLIATHDYYRSEWAGPMHLYFIHFTDWQKWKMTSLFLFFFPLCIWHQYFILFLSHCGNQFLSLIRCPLRCPWVFLSLKGSAFISGRLGSASSNSSCGSADYIGEVIPHHPGINMFYLFIYILSVRVHSLLLQTEFPSNV